MPAGQAFSPLNAFALFSPLTWQGNSPGQEIFFAAPVAMMNLWANAWGIPGSAAMNPQSSAAFWPWQFGNASSPATAPGYGMIKMSITFPDNTEIKFAFPGPPA